MKSKRIGLIVSIFGVIAAAFFLFACSDKTDSDTSGSSINGTYYHYVDGTWDKSDYITINGDKWTVGTQTAGSIEVSGNTITFYMNLEVGGSVKYATCTVIDGVLKIRGIGGYDYYCKDGKTPPQEGFTVTLNANGGACSVTTQNYAAGAVMADLPTPTYKGYVFICWQDTFGVKFDSASVMPESDFTLYAVWEKEVTEYSDSYVSFKPATEGRKHDDTFYIGPAFDAVDKYVYVEITSDDLGGADKVGTSNNFTLRTMEGMEYSIKSGYSWNWYQGNWNTPNGAQLFNLNYGSNLQFVTITENGIVVRRYLVDIYVKHDYYISLYSDLLADEPYDRVRVIENEHFDTATPIKEISGFEFDKRVYYNSQTKEYESFVYSAVIRRNWNLYQTFKPVTLTPDLDGGILTEDITITPYTRFVKLPVPTKDGYDFIGWEFAERQTNKCFADITGYMGLNYLNADNNEYTLKAHWEKKRFYHYTDGDALKTKTLVPIVAYDDKNQNNIVEILYAVKGETCPAPTLAPPSDGMFKEWRTYQYADNSDKFDFYGDIDEPTAIFGEFEYPSGEYTAIPLSSRKTFNNGETKFTLNLLTDQAYTLKVSATRSTTLTVKAYAGNSEKTYNINGSTTSITLQYSNSGTVKYPEGVRVTVTLSDNSGSFTTELIGATTKSNARQLNGDNTYIYGDECTVTTGDRMGCEFVGWYNGQSRLTSAMSYTFAMPSENIEYLAKYDIKAEMSNFIFTSTETTLNITGVIDKNVTEITVPDYVTSISQGAFSGCNSSTSITIPFIGASKNGTSNTHFGYIFGASSNNNSSYVPSSLKTVIITGGTSIENYAFSGCSGLTSITIPNGVTSIGSSAFYGCSSLTSITIPDSVTSIGASAFEGCSKLESITLPFVGASKDGTSNTHFGYIFGASSNNNSSYVPSSLKTVIITGGTSIENYAFSVCSGLTSITIPNGVTSIGSGAFYGCSSLTSITIPNSVTSIGYYAFSGCNSLTSITIPDSVTSIGDGAFEDCSKLGSITLPFVGASKDGTINTYFGYIFGANNSSYAPSSLKTVIITGGTSIGRMAFYGCSGLTSITIPNSVTSIGDYAFSGCSSLTSITIPNSVTSIGSSAFYDCSGLTSITIPNSVTSIGSSAFYGCSGLTSITIPNSVTSIGDYAFSGCSSLTSITIPDSVTSIGNWAFSGCSSLTSVYYSGTPDEWNAISMRDYNSCLTTATRYYYSETRPETSGNYWHYNDDGEIVVW